MTHGILLAVAVSACLLATPAQAVKTLCCTNTQGRNVCGDTLPLECYGRAYRIINEQGMTLRQVDAPLTAEQRAQRDIELARKKKEAVEAFEERRRDDALLAAYADEKDIDTVRDRALEAARTNLKEIQVKLDEAQKQKKKLDDELEFYKKKGPPESLKQQIKANETDVQSMQASLDAKKLEMEKITARFDAERQRYTGLKKGTIPRKPLPPPPADIKPPAGQP